MPRLPRLHLDAWLTRREDDLLALAFFGPYVAVILGVLGEVRWAPALLAAPVVAGVPLAVRAFRGAGEPWDRLGFGTLAIAGLLHLVPALAAWRCRLPWELPSGVEMVILTLVMALVGLGLAAFGRDRAGWWAFGGAITLLVAVWGLLFYGACPAI